MRYIFILGWYILLAIWLLLERIFKLFCITCLVLWYFNFKREWLRDIGWYVYTVFTMYDCAIKIEGEPSYEWIEGYYLTLEDYFSKKTTAIYYAEPKPQDEKPKNIENEPKPEN